MTKFRVLHLRVPAACAEISSVYRSLALSGSANMQLHFTSALLQLSPEDRAAVGVEYVHAADLTFAVAGDDPERRLVVILPLLNQVFTLTNTIDREWYLEKELTVPSKGGKPLCVTVAATEQSKRSTSVGDVIISGGGAVFVVAPVGFQFVGQFPELRF